MSYKEIIDQMQKKQEELCKNNIELYGENCKLKGQLEWESGERKKAQEQLESLTSLRKDMEILTNQFNQLKIKCENKKQERLRQREQIKKLEEDKELLKSQLKSKPQSLNLFKLVKMV